MRTYGNLVGGRWGPEGNPLTVRSPWDGREVGQVTVASAELLDGAIAAAVQAQPTVAALSREARSAILERIAEGLAKRSEELV